MVEALDANRKRMETISALLCGQARVLPVDHNGSDGSRISDAAKNTDARSTRDAAVSLKHV